MNLSSRVIFSGIQESDGTPILKPGTIVMMCLESHDPKSEKVLYKVICDDGSSYITAENYLEVIV